MNKLVYFGRCRFIARRMTTGQSSTSNDPRTSSSGSLSNRFRPSEFQKTILVWTKKYKTKEEIPSFVSADLIERSRSEARIKISNIAILLTILASLGAVFAGKAAAKRGESVHQMNLDWHRKYEEEHKAKESGK